MSKTYWILVVAMVIFQITDVITTYIGLKMGLVEGNVFAKRFIHEKAVAIGMKILGTGVIFWVSYGAGMENPEIGSSMVGYALGNVVQATLSNIYHIKANKKKR